MTRVRAAVFDMDGTLVDNMPFHAQAWIEIAARLGVTLTRERFERELAGRKNDETFALLLGRPVPPEEAERLAHVKETRYRELYRPHVAPLRGLHPLLDRLRGASVTCAVATAAPSENRAMVLGGLALANAFASIVGAEHVLRGKPAPDLFLAAARQLAIEPSACIVFEDAVNGIVAARAAGMRAVGVTTTTAAAALRAAGAEWTAPEFESLPEELVRALVG
jgi:beta-phosphoglucomutase family hydrolase